MNILWKPTSKIIENSILNQFTKYIGKDFEYNFKNLWEWSVQNPEIFWSKFWDFSKILGDKGNTIIEKNKIFNKSKFFPDSKVNYTENILRKKSLDIAVNFLSEKDLRKISHGKSYTKKFVVYPPILKILILAKTCIKTTNHHRPSASPSSSRPGITAALNCDYIF